MCVRLCPGGNGGKKQTEENEDCRAHTSSLLAFPKGRRRKVTVLQRQLSSSAALMAARILSGPLLRKFPTLWFASWTSISSESKVRSRSSGRAVNDI